MRFAQPTLMLAANGGLVASLTGHCFLGDEGKRIPLLERVPSEGETNRGHAGLQAVFGHTAEEMVSCDPCGSLVSYRDSVFGWAL
jgi:hypothetical protein